MPDRVICTSELTRRLGVSRQTLWKWCKSGHFPASRQVGPAGGRMGWLESEVDVWIRTRVIAVGADNAGPGK